MILETSSRFDYRAGGKHPILGDDDDSILDGIILVRNVGAGWKGTDDYVCAQAGVLVNNGALNVTSWTDTDGRFGRIRIGMIHVIVCTHHDTILDLSPGGYDTAHADNRMCDLRLLDLATFGQ